MLVGTKEICNFARYKHNSIAMKPSEQAIKQIERAIKKIAEKFPASQEASLLTDVHLRVIQESGELLAFDDDGREITRCVIEQWIDNKDDSFYDDVATTLRKQLKRLSSIAGNLAIIKPYSFVLEDDENETLAELFVADDDTVIIDPDIMENLDQELDEFFDQLMKE